MTEPFALATKRGLPPTDDQARTIDEVLGDTARARREAESALRYRGVGAEAGDYLLARDSSVDNLRRLAEVEGREGRSDRSIRFLRAALEAAEEEITQSVPINITSNHS